MSKPSIPKGTRDFLPLEMSRRNYIFDTIKKIFCKFGFEQIETPALENLSTLLGKYGEEGDRLLFKVLNSGNFLEGLDFNELQDTATVAKLSTKISEKGLRYDLTVPFARFIVQHRDKIPFPFRRFQIQPVWRADRPQKGRYREFYQCDADVIGSDSLINESELIEIIDEVFRKLQINVAIKLNNRKILAGIAEVIEQEDKLKEITVAIDKFDKIGIENVKVEMLNNGISQHSIELLQPIFDINGNNIEKLEQLKKILSTSKTGLKGIEELEIIFKYIADSNIKNIVELDLTLARGLNYYTGAIIEVKSLDVQIGSITGGGRYDNLTTIFGLQGTSGVGISFGADRIYDVMEALNLFPENETTTIKILFVCFDNKAIEYAIPILRKIRSEGIEAEIYPEPVKMKKQMQYANDKKTPFVAIIGENEINRSSVTIKNMKTGEQKLIASDKIIEELHKIG